jgi:hypothetical protein
MPVIFQKFIYRSDLRANPDVLYLFGDNLKRQGLGGQAKEMRGEPNAVGIATKKLPSQYDNSFFSDEDFDLFEENYLADIEPALKALDRGLVLIIPSDGLGTGLSELPTRAPIINNYIINQIKEMRKVYG